MVTALAMSETSMVGIRAPARQARICRQPSFDPSKVKVSKGKTSAIPGN